MLPFGSEFSKHEPYVYFGKLQFLESSVVNKDTESIYETSALIPIYPMQIMKTW